MRSRLKFVLFAALGLLFIYFFAKDLEWAMVWQAVRGAKWSYLLVALALVFSTFYIRALRWRTLLAPVAPKVSFWSLVAATTLGFSAVAIFGRTGEIIRPVALSSKEHIRPSATIATIMIERIFDSVCLVLIFAANLLVFDRPLAGGMSMGPIRWAGGLLLLGSVVGIFFLTMLRRHKMATLQFLDRVLSRIGKKPRRMILSFVGNFAEALSVLHDARELVIVSVITLGLWIIGILDTVLVLNAFGLDTTVSDSIFVTGFAMIGSLVPTPGGGAGAFHAATQKGMMLLGTDENVAAAVSIVLHLLAFGTALIPGVYYLARGGISISRLRAALHEDLNSQADFQVATTRT